MSQHAAQAKTIQTILLLVLMGMVFRGTAFSQSLADLARQQRAKKAAEEQTAPQFTNDAMDAVQPEDSESAAPASAALAAKAHPATSADVQPDPKDTSGTSTPAVDSAATEVPDTSTAAGKSALSGGKVPAAKIAADPDWSAGTSPVHSSLPSLNQLVPKVPTGRLLIVVFELLVGIVTGAALWAVFIKADQPGWAAITPIYNLFVWFRIAAKPAWWIVLLLLPLVGLVVMVSVNIGIAKRFGKDVGFGIGLTFLPFIFYPVLAWSDASVSS